MKIKNKIKFMLVVFLASITIVNAQYGSFGITDAQSIGMGNSFGTAFNTLAIGKNPALLAYPRDTSSLIAIQFPNVSAMGLNSTMSMNDFNAYFDNSESRILSDQDKQNFYNTINDKPGIYFNGGSKIFAISWMHSKEIGAFGISMTDYISGGITIPKSLVDLALNGNKQFETYSFDDFNLNTWWIRTTSLSYARNIIDFAKTSFIKSITGGISLKMVSGYAYTGIEEMNTSIYTGENNAINAKVHYLARSSFSPNLGVGYSFDETTPKSNIGISMDPAGSGFGFDIGFAFELKHGIRVGLAINDIGSITWDKGTAEHKADGEIDINDLFDREQRDEFETFLDDTSYSIGSFSTDLPTVLRLSLAYDIVKSFENIPGELLLTLDYHQGFNEMPGNSTTPRISFGAMWKTKPYIPVVSTGFSNDIAGNLRWAFGLGFSTSVVDINLATMDILSLMGASKTSFISVGLNSIWKIAY